MKEEEFEDIFGNVPFENIKKIQKYIEDNYISKDKIRDLIKELEKQDKEIRFSKNYLIIPVLKELLEEE